MSLEELQSLETIDRDVLNYLESTLPQLDRFSKPSFCPVPTGSVDIVWFKEGVECCLAPKSLSMHYTTPPYRGVFYEIPLSSGGEFLCQTLTAWLDSNKQKC